MEKLLVTMEIIRGTADCLQHPMLLEEMEEQK
jgi:hypothetical protein